ncbi:Do family serine endopeptidase [Algihabitans albus]|uniref:Do family serine endopeptidase n=1 Tax=Algihabitans albus TaxID=2164067 RepID=UPI001F314E08|nr:Do family serine endopeptidase [Algihabitans albus]
MTRAEIACFVSLLRPRATALLAAGVWVLAAVLAAPAAAQPQGAPISFADLADQLLPTVVNISTTQVVERGDQEDFEEMFREFFERRGQGAPPPRRRANSLGSGFIIDPEGYVVTNNHVIAEADTVEVVLSDDTTYEAEIIGSDPETDLALLKVNPTSPLPSTIWGNSNSVRVGDWVLAVGNPFGLGGSVTAGIVSARGRDINAGPYDDFLQTDAAINRGNSGGPMFNLDGEVIGINTAIFSPSGGSIGIGFAVPSAIAQNVIDSLRRFGEVRRGWLGVRIQTVTEELAGELALPPPATGAYVANVIDGGPAQSAGIVQGDVIITFDDRPVADTRGLVRMVAETSVGRDVDVVIWREGSRQTMQVNLGQRDAEALAAAAPPPPDPEEVRDLPALGLSLGVMTDERRETFALEEGVGGVIVTEVDSGGSAEEKGLQPGDVIVEVDQERVATPDEVESYVEQAREAERRSLTLLVYRGGEYQWIVLRIGQG